VLPVVGDYLYCNFKSLGRFRVVEKKGDRADRVYLEDHMGMRGTRDRPRRISLNRRALEEQGRDEHRNVIRGFKLRFSVRPPIDESVESAREMLGVNDTYSDDEVKAGYRRLAWVKHPDRGGKSEEFHKLTRARGLLLGRLGWGSGD
jgi:hypothetical protein